VDHFRIEPRSGVVSGDIALDGEIVSLRPPLEYRLVRDALKVVVASE
jgi:hypothetical protein